MSHETFVAARLETSFVPLPRHLVTFGHRVEFLPDSDSLVLGQGQQKAESDNAPSGAREVVGSSARPQAISTQYHQVNLASPLSSPGRVGLRCDHFVLQCSTLLLVRGCGPFILGQATVRILDILRLHSMTASDLSYCIRHRHWSRHGLQSRRNTKRNTPL